jgi:hypothetical protein
MPRNTLKNGIADLGRAGLPPRRADATQPTLLKNGRRFRARRGTWPCAPTDRPKPRPKRFSTVRHIFPAVGFEARAMPRSGSSINSSKENVTNEAVNLLKISMMVFWEIFKAVNSMKTGILSDLKPSTY